MVAFGKPVAATAMVSAFCFVACPLFLSPLPSSMRSLLPQANAGDTAPLPEEPRSFASINVASLGAFSVAALLTSAALAQKTSVLLRRPSSKIAARRAVSLCAFDSEQGIAAPSISSLKAFEGEIGVQPPMGYWDPLGLGAEGSPEDFKRRRATEYKHGRVSMLACIGYMVPEYYKFPGEISPWTAKLKFEIIGNGMAAFQKIPAAGWYQMFAFVGLCEKGFLVADDNRPPGDIEAAGLLGVPGGPRIRDGAEKTRRLNAEIANGRLAMFSIIGMLFQDGLTGQAWGSWASYGGSPLRAFDDSTDARR